MVQQAWAVHSTGGLLCMVTQAWLCMVQQACCAWYRRPVSPFFDPASNGYCAEVLKELEHFIKEGAKLHNENK